MAGHVFVVEGDIRRIASDAWLLPCSQSGHVASSWRKPPLSASDCELIKAQDGPNSELSGEDGKPRVRRIAADGGRVWLTNVASTRAPLSWRVDGAEQFLRAATSALAGSPPGEGRAKHLLALPLIGAGHGGARHEAGAVTRELLPRLRDLVRALDVDIVLVTREGPATAAAQRERLEVESEAWGGMQRWRHAARVLAERASDGQLVLFLGAGASAGAGLPTWPGLLQELAAQADVAVAQMPEFVKLSLLDQASLVERRLGRSAMTTAIEQRMQTERYSLVHALLANLPVREAVTTNYDRCFELACAESGGRDIAVLPAEAAVQRGRWLLKLHGCVKHKRIVLTRSDYLRYGDQRAALLGLVQALLITRHMLFVGFSLNDENFHRIMDDVRKVVPARAAVSGAGAAAERAAGLGAGAERGAGLGISAGRGVGAGAERGHGSGQGAAYGTALLVGVEKIQTELWRDDLRCLRFGDLPDGARQQMVFLDYLLAHAGQYTGHLLDERYAGSLSEAELRLGDRLRQFERSATKEERATSAWKEIERLVARLGGGSRGNGGGG